MLLSAVATVLTFSPPVVVSLVIKLFPATQENLEAPNDNDLTGTGSSFLEVNVALAVLPSLVTAVSVVLPALKQLIFNV